MVGHCKSVFQAAIFAFTLVMLPAVATAQGEKNSTEPRYSANEFSVVFDLLTIKKKAQNRAAARLGRHQRNHRKFMRRFVTQAFVEAGHKKKPNRVKCRPVWEHLHKKLTRDQAGRSKTSLEVFNRSLAESLDRKEDQNVVDGSRREAIINRLKQKDPSKYRFDSTRKMYCRFRTDAHTISVEEAVALLEGKRKRFGKWTYKVKEADFNYQMGSFFAPNDPLYLDQVANYAPHNIEAAWDDYRGSSSIVIAIVDTGTFGGHTDMAANRYANSNETGPCSLEGADDGASRIVPAGSPDCNDDGDHPDCYHFINGQGDLCRLEDAEGNGIIDDFHGANFLTFPLGCQENCFDRGNPEDDHGHGSAVAGVASASFNNDTGMAGVCPNCTYMPIRAGFRNPSGEAQYDLAALEAGIGYAVMEGADVINMSLGSAQPILGSIIEFLHDDPSTPEVDGTEVVIVAAAGNSGDDTEYYPAAWADRGYPQVISVAALDNLARAPYSTYGEGVTVGAFGGSDANPVTSITLDDDYSTEFGGNPLKGTSFAAPFVAGVVGLVRSHKSGDEVNARQMGNHLQGTGIDIGDSNFSSAFRAVDVDAALGENEKPRYNVTVSIIESEFGFALGEVNLTLVDQATGEVLLDSNGEEYRGVTDGAGTFEFKGVEQDTEFRIVLDPQVDGKEYSYADQGGTNFEGVITDDNQSFNVLATLVEADPEDISGIAEEWDPDLEQIVGPVEDADILLIALDGDFNEVELSPSDPSTTGLKTTTAADGSFSFEAVPGGLLYRVSIIKTDPNGDSWDFQLGGLPGGLISVNPVSKTEELDTFRFIGKPTNSVVLVTGCHTLRDGGDPLPGVTTTVTFPFDNSLDPLVDEDQDGDGCYQFEIEKGLSIVVTPSKGWTDENDNNWYYVFELGQAGGRSYGSENNIQEDKEFNFVAHLIVPSYSITVRVEDESGRGVPSHSVAFRYDEAPHEPKTDNTSSGGSSTFDGFEIEIERPFTLSLPPRDGWEWVTPVNGRMEGVEITGGGAEFTFVVRELPPEDFDVVVRFVDENGDPVPLITADIQVAGEGDTSPLTSGQSGSVTFRGSDYNILEGADYTIQLQSPGGLGGSPLWVFSENPVVHNDIDQDMTHTVTLTRNPQYGKIFGYIKKESGSPVQGIEIGLEDSAGNVVLGNDGQPLIVVTNGSGYFEFPSQFQEGSTYTVFPRGNDPDLPAHWRDSSVPWKFKHKHPETGQLGQPFVSVTFPMYDPASGASIDQQVDFVAFPIQLDYLISGRVFWEQTGGGASDVTLFTFGPLSLTTQTDAAGNYAFRLTPEQFSQFEGRALFLFAMPPGTEEVRAVNSSDPRRYYITIGQTLQGGPGNVVDADWQLTGNPPVVTLGGQVTVDGVAAEGVLIRYVVEGQQNTIATDENGLYRISVDPGAPYDIQVASSNLQPPVYQGLTFTPVPGYQGNADESKTNLNFEAEGLPPEGYSISGSAYYTYNTSQVIPGVRVKLLEIDLATGTVIREVDEKFTDSAGAYEFTDVEAGTFYRVIATKSGLVFAPKQYNFEMPEEDVTERDFRALGADEILIDGTLTRAASVGDPNQIPWVGVAIREYRSQQGEVYVDGVRRKTGITRTDETGYWYFIFKTTSLAQYVVYPTYGDTDSYDYYHSSNYARHLRNNWGFTRDGSRTFNVTGVRK